MNRHRSHRCHRCRNPIRTDAIARSGTFEELWFHPDCWDAECLAEQLRYEREVQARGLIALLEPYVATAPAEGRTRSPYPMLG